MIKFILSLMIDNLLFVIVVCCVAALPPPGRQQQNEAKNQTMATWKVIELEFRFANDLRRRLMAKPQFFPSIIRLDQKRFFYPGHRTRGRPTFINKQL